ncbi:MAG TPA: hypothetical protein DDY49_14920 [Paenibacillaceae bacterium]|mgnify:CR=1 FL=1|nr:hypothetical protein [Paenibacillaceae bacterium]
MHTGFTGWISNGKYTTIILLILCYLLLLSGCILTIYTDNQLTEAIMVLLNNKTTPILALIGIIMIVSMIFIYIQFLIGSLTMFIISKYVFKIQSTFPVFFRILLILCIFMTVGSFYHVLLFSASLNVLLVLINPFFPSGVIALYYLLRYVIKATPFQCLLFSSSIYLLIIILIIIGGGY